MFSNFRDKASFLLPLLLAVVASACGHKTITDATAESAKAEDAAHSAVPFRICAEPDNLPYSQQSTRSGLDVEVAELLAKDLGRPLEIKWVPQEDQSYFRQTISAGHCDAIMNVPAGFERLLTTRPWYRTGFVFVAKENRLPKVKSFADRRLRKMSFGVPNTGLGETAPVLALGRNGLIKNVHPYSIFSTKEILEDVVSNKLDAGIVWGPFGSWYAQQERLPLAVHLTPEKDEKTPLAYDITIGVRKGNEELKNKLNLALERQHDAIAAVLNKWRIPLSKSL
jgi:mxaJ protein